MSFSVDLSPYEIRMLDTRQLVTKLNGALTAIQSAVNAAGLGVFNLQGFFDASGGSYPSNPDANDAWVISVAGTISTIEYSVGDVIGYTGSEWVTLMSAGGGDVDLSDPGPIGDDTPDTVNATSYSISGTEVIDGSGNAEFNALDDTPIGDGTPSTICGTTGEFTDTTDATSTTAAALKTAGGLGVAKKLNVGSFSILGDSAPAIKMKKVTGTTAGSEGAAATAAHGVTTSKILSISVLVSSDIGRIAPGFTSIAGYQFDVRADGTNVNVHNHASNAENIISKPFTVLITYEE